MNETKPNKPIALAITLVILVFCLMLNIVFISKNISLKQDDQVKTGKTIVALLEKVQSQSQFIHTHLVSKEDELIIFDAAMHTSANEIMVYELERLKRDISELLLITSAIKPEVFSAQALNGEAPKINSFLERLAQVNYLQDTMLYHDIQRLVSDIINSTSQFNYKLGQSKTAMIRMSNGFEWVETLQSLDKVLSSM